jgi:hypothetical protein
MQKSSAKIGDMPPFKDLFGHLLPLLFMEEATVRQSGAHAMLLQLCKHTNLSKNDLRGLSKAISPAPAATIVAASVSKAKKLKTPKADSPGVAAIRSDTTKYPVNDRGPGSGFQAAVREQRARDKKK